MSQSAEDTAYHPLQITPQPPLPTVRIQSDDTESGYVIINESEFDKTKHKRFADKKAE